jgi:hypothetical protein
MPSADHLKVIQKLTEESTKDLPVFKIQDALQFYHTTNNDNGGIGVRLLTSIHAGESFRTTKQLPSS